MIDKKKDESSFQKASNCEELIECLKVKVKNLHNTQNGETKYLYHYTNIKSVVGILKTKVWYLNSPDNMNDGLEIKYLNGELKNMFYACFMNDATENIAMWNMYAQPWKNGVMIKIPVEFFKKWIKSDNSVYVVEDTDVLWNMDITEYASLKTYKIAYLNEGKEHDDIVCTEEHNTNFSDLINESSLKGYIKHYAWNYEKEIRLRIDTNTKETYNKLAISIPDEVINSIELVTGPRFESNLLSRIHNEVDPNFDKSRIKKSDFDKLLKWVYCDSCLKKRIR